MQLFLDCDGVLADFDSRATTILGMRPQYFEELHGEDLFWNRLRSDPTFYENLPLMEDALLLVDAVKHLNPIILTGCPAGGWAEEQKQSWKRKHFPSLDMVCCCPTADKYKHIPEHGAVLVDDRLKHRESWETAGGIFVHHIDTKTSITRLRMIRLLPDWWNLGFYPDTSRLERMNSTP